MVDLLHRNRRKLLVFFLSVFLVSAQFSILVTPLSAKMSVKNKEGMEKPLLSWVFQIDT